MFLSPSRTDLPEVGARVFVIGAGPGGLEQLAAHPALLAALADGLLVIALLSDEAEARELELRAARAGAYGLNALLHPSSSALPDPNPTMTVQ